MFIKKLIVKNYRTLENIEVNFNGYYTAISGKNNAGKSNIFRAIRGIFNRRVRLRMLGGAFLGMDGLDWNDDITSWKKDNKEDIKIELSIQIHRDNDATIYRFLTEFIFKDEENIKNSDIEELKISCTEKYNGESLYQVFLGNIEIVDGYKKQEVLKKIQNTECLIFHNSTNKGISPFDESFDRMSNFINRKDLISINKKRDELLKLIQKSLKHHQNELTNLLGNLEEKYEVSLSTRGLNFENQSIDISLKEKGTDVSLDDWGSGTRNRTLIFLNILNANRLQQTQNGMETDKITPIILIEEPESFLHPQAQAEFGRILQDLANSFRIQIIVTTHSPYLLCFKSPESNILLERDTKVRSKSPSSHIIDTSTEEWYAPFVNALGISSTDFGPMKDIIFSEKSKILLVEGIIDKEYFEYFQDERFGKDALCDDIEIFAYDGADNVKNHVLMKFIKSKFKKVVLTVDLDRFESIKRSVVNIGFTDKKDFFAIGKAEPGNKCIEGLLPPSITSSVYAQYPSLVQAVALEGDKDSRNRLKKHLLEKFKETPCSEEEYKYFFEIIKKINKFFRGN